MSAPWDDESFSCPYCGEENFFRPEPVDGPNRFVQDCAICCHPVLIETRMRGGQLVHIRIERENG